MAAGAPLLTPRGRDAGAALALSSIVVFGVVSLH
jgi:hypothetical protein